MLILHGVWRSLAAYRVCAGLLLRGVAFEERMHDLDRVVPAQPGLPRLRLCKCRASPAAVRTWPTRALPPCARGALGLIVPRAIG